MRWVPVDRCLACGSPNLRLDPENESYTCEDCGSGAGGASFWKDPLTGENP